MEINRNSSINNSFLNNIEQQSQSDYSYLARKINAPDEVSFSTQKGKKATTNIFQRLWSGVVALALSFSINGCAANPNTQKNVANQPTKPQTTVSEENDTPNTNETEIKINDDSYYISNFKKTIHTKDSSTESKVFQKNFISSFSKEESEHGDIPPMPVIPEEENIETLPKYAPPPDIPEIEEEESVVVKYAPPPPVTPEVPEEESVVVKYAPPPPVTPEVPEEESAVVKYAPPPPVTPEVPEEVVDPLPKYAPPPDVEQDLTEEVNTDVIVDTPSEEN